MPEFTKEEVEAMARAAGYEIEWHNKVPWLRGAFDDPQGKAWLPSDRTHDCFNLMVDAKITIGRADTFAIAGCESDWIPDEPFCENFSDHTCKYHAFRIAICRAAIHKGVTNDPT